MRLTEMVHRYGSFLYNLFGTSAYSTSYDGIDVVVYFLSGTLLLHTRFRIREEMGILVYRLLFRLIGRYVYYSMTI